MANNASNSQPAAAGNQANASPPPPWMARYQPGWPIPEMKSVSASANLNCLVDLRHLALHTPLASEYNPSKLNAVIMRIRHPNCTGTVYHTGKMLVAGATSEALARLAGRRFARAVQRCGFRVRFTDFRSYNYLGTAKCDFSIRLDRIEENFSRFAKYEPELFPGLIFSMVRPKVKFGVFAGGGINIRGAQSEADIFEGFANLYPILEQYQIRGNAIAAAPAAPAAQGANSGAADDADPAEEEDAE